ncbi:YciI family protein [Phenylobacterium sp.]|uniref:YciI family protein n=1 Tax=Phenylobacterium sp. TaxID=1871053 RepID=UPI00301BF64E
MQYMILIYEPEDGYAGEAGEAALMEIVGKHVALAEDLETRGVLRGGGGLKETSTATTIVTRDGRQTLHDGPFAETREHLGGYYLIEVPDLDAALEIARRVPVIDGGKVEVRPLADY